MNANPTMQIVQQKTIVLGGGCFWCTEAVFSDLKGVVSVLPGYAGGTTTRPTYEQVCSGSTGHAEVVEVIFDPEQISLQDILGVFFSTHNPTTLNKQGNDDGTQYRSIILYTTPEQKLAVEEYITKLNKAGLFDDPIVTELALLSTFYPAEEYHREYYKKNPDQAYCQVMINPKLQKLRAQYAHLVKK